MRFMFEESSLKQVLVVILNEEKHNTTLNVFPSVDCV